MSARPSPVAKLRSGNTAAGVIAPPRSASFCRRRHLALTLVEVLIVLAILAVLVGVLLPIIARSREASRRTRCLANLSALGHAMANYAHDWDDRLPNTGVPMLCSTLLGSTPALLNFAESYVVTPQVFHCPSDRDPPPTSIISVEYDPPRHLNSVHISYDFYSPYWDPDYGPFLSQLKGRAPLAWDLHGGAAQPSPLQNHGTRGGNVLFADGHADWLDQPKWDDENWPHPAEEFFPAFVPLQEN